MWEVTDKVRTTTIDPLCYISGLDTYTTRCIVTAAVLNKFRHMANEQKTTTISVSAAKLKEVIGTNKSRGKVRLVLNELKEKGFIKARLVGREYEYTIDIDKINYVNSPEVIKNDSNSLTNIFGEYRKYVTGNETSPEQKVKWNKEFSSILLDGKPAEALKHIMAYLIYSEDITITNPIQIEETYHIHYAMAYSNLSNSKAKRALFKAKHSIRKNSDDLNKVSQVIDRCVKPTILAADKWKMVLDWLKNNNNLLLKLFSYKNYGTNIDFEDYKSQASIICFELIDKRNMLPSEKLFSSRVFFELRTYMELLRPKNRSGKKYKKLEEALIKASESGLYTDVELREMEYNLKEIDKKIITTSFADLEYTSSGEYYNFIEKYVAPSKSDENISRFSNDVKTHVLTRLNELKTSCNYLYTMVCHIHGFECEQLSYRELANKYKIPYSTIYGHVQFVLKCLKDNKEIKINESMLKANNILFGVSPP